jgi:hypothetical protein
MNDTVSISAIENCLLELEKLFFHAHTLNDEQKRQKTLDTYSFLYTLIKLFIADLFVRSNNRKVITEFNNVNYHNVLHNELSSKEASSELRLFHDWIEADLFPLLDLYKNDKELFIKTLNQQGKLKLFFFKNDCFLDDALDA